MKTLQLFSVLISLLSIVAIPSLIAQNNKPLPVLDKTKSYPPKKLEFETQIRYVALETSKDVLMDGTCGLRYASDDKLIFSDEIRGDVFIFNTNGKILSSFNQKGGLCYTFITFVAYDEKQNELFILDSVRKKIFVFSETGTLLRSFSTPQKTNVQEIYNFDDETLLAFDEDRYGSNQPTKPYFYLAKNDGNLTAYVDIEVEKTNPGSFVEDLGKNEARSYVFSHSAADNCKFGNEFILSNKSMDMVYLLKQDKNLIPLFTQIPSVHSEHPTAASVGMMTDRFFKICVSDYDIKEGVKIMKAGGRWKPKFKNFILDRNTGEFFQDTNYKEFTVHKIDIPKSRDYFLMQAVNLVKANQQKKLEGELKVVASKLDIGDNPVLKIQTFK
jgi:hypothetical protein